MYYEFNLGELKEILDYVEDIKEQIEEDLINTMKKYVQVDNSGTYPKSKFYYDGVIPGMEEHQEELEEILEHVEDFEKKIEEIIEAIENTKAVEHENSVFVYEPKDLNKYIENIKGLLSKSNIEYKNIFKASDTYKYWEKEVSNRLDDTLWEAIKDPIEEMKQRDDERVFRYNKKIMQGLNDKLISIVSDDFKKDKDKLNDIKSKLDELGILDDILGIGQIARNNVRYGSANKVATKINILNMKEVNSYIENKFEPNFQDILEHFRAGDTLIVSGSMITDDILQNLNNSGLFKITLIDGKYKIIPAYDDIANWARDYPYIVEEIFEDAMKSGLDGIYKLDKNTGKWYSYDADGNIKYFTELPSGVGNMLDGANKVLGPLGIAIDINAMTEAIESGDLSDILSTAGGIAGAWAGVIVFAAIDPIPGDEFILGLVGTFIAEIFGSKGGSYVGKKIGEKLENGHAYWE